MIKKTVYIFASFFAVGISLASISDIQKSGGAPAYNTGAPQELTCARGGCHDGIGSEPNIADGGANIVFGNSESEYVPGQTYNVRAEVFEDGTNRFGFQMTSLITSDFGSGPAGIVEITDTVNTWQLDSNIVTQGCCTDRVWIEHTNAGTFSPTMGSMHWDYNWTAPVSNMGPITFFLAALASNNDGTDTLDHTYSTHFTISPTTVNLFETNSPFSDLKIYPNPTKGNLFVEFRLDNPAEVLFSVMDLKGNTLLERIHKQEEKLNIQQKIRLKSSLSRGIYLIQISIGEQRTLKKVFLI